MQLPFLHAAHAPGPFLHYLLSLSLIPAPFPLPDREKELERWGRQRGRKREGAAARRIFIRRGRRRQEEGSRSWYSLGGVQQPAWVAAHPRQVAHLHDRFRAGRFAGAEVPREEGTTYVRFFFLLFGRHVRSITSNNSSYLGLLVTTIWMFQWSACVVLLRSAAPAPRVSPPAGTERRTQESLTIRRKLSGNIPKHPITVHEHTALWAPWNLCDATETSAFVISSMVINTSTCFPGRPASKTGCTLTYRSSYRSHRGRARGFAEVTCS